jgi:hypothetical protein
MPAQAGIQYPLSSFTSGGGDYWIARSSRAMTMGRK